MMCDEGPVRVNGDTRDRINLLLTAIVAIALTLPIQGQCGEAADGTSGKRFIRETLPPFSKAERVEVGERMFIERDYEVATVPARPRITPMDPSRDIVLLYNAPSASAALRGELRRGTEVARIVEVGNWVKVRDPSQRIGWIDKGEITETPVEIITARPGNIQRTLEYTGRVDNRLTLSYKEFTETTNGLFIRPAFTQDFTFDLSHGSEIAVKGVRLRVIEANNTGITYEVLKSFGR